MKARGWMGTAVALLALAAAVSAGEFSATITTDMRGKSASYPIHVKGKSYCTVQEDGGQKIRVLVDMERNVTTVIVASEKAFIEIPSDGLQSKANDPIQAVLHVPKELVVRDAGKETIEGYECEKREYAFNDQLYQTVWFSTKLGLPLKIEQHQGQKRKFAVTGITQGPVDAALFAVPEGYKKMDGPPERAPKPAPEAKPKASIKGTVYGRAPWGGRLAPNAEARIHFDQQTEQRLMILNESSGSKANATVSFFLHGKPVGGSQKVELYGNGRKEVEKNFAIDANEARVEIHEGTCFVLASQNEKMGRNDKLDLSYLCAPMQRQVMLRPNQPSSVLVRGDCMDGPASEVYIKLTTPGAPMEYTVTLKNGEFWRRPIDMSEKVSALEAHVKSGAARLQVIQGSRAKPQPPYVAGNDKKMRGAIAGAINYDDVEWMKHALDAGLALDYQPSRNKPMIHLVASKASPEMLALLIERGADVEAVEKSGVCLLGAAARNPRYWRENLLLLLEQGADVKFKNRFGFTPLHYAVMQAGGSKPEVVGSARLLLEKGADVNAPLSKGDTPLLKAVQGNDLALVKLLLEYGADVNAKGTGGRTPISSAEEFGFAEILAALKAPPAKQ